MLEIALTQDLQDAFAELTGDFCSLHTNPSFARKTRFRGPIVHGLAPVLLLLGRRCYENGERPIQLKHFACAFREPARIGDVLGLRMQTAQGPFEIVRTADGAVITAGLVQFTTADKSPPGEERLGSLQLAELEEAQLLGDELAVGLIERIRFRAEPASVRGVLRLLDAQLGGPKDPDAFNDPNFTALLMTSPLIGMRLPGRFATFVDLSVYFEGDISPREKGTLEGVITNLSRSNERVSIDLAWRQATKTIATGAALSLARTVNTPSIGSEEVTTRHLDLGFKGKTALVTGASRGIGQAIARLLAAHGAFVVVHYFRGEEDAAETVEDIIVHGGRAMALGADLSSDESIDAMFAEIQTALGGVDILVNNAVGDFTPKSTETLTRRDYMRELDVTLFGAHACSTRAIPHMKRRRWGKIINMGTIVTHVPVSGQNKYIVAKSALVGYTRSLASELVGDNIQVNMVAPAMTDTTLIAALPKALVERLTAEAPSQRLLNPIDVAKTVVFLASDWASPISGQQIVLSGGEFPFL